MLRDWGSREGDFIALTRSVRERLVDLASATDTHTCTPIQGGGTFAVEAMLGTLVPRHAGRALFSGERRLWPTRGRYLRVCIEAIGAAEMHRALAVRKTDALLRITLMPAL